MTADAGTAGFYRRAWGRRLHGSLGGLADEHWEQGGGCDDRDH